MKKIVLKLIILSTVAFLFTSCNEATDKAGVNKNSPSSANNASSSQTSEQKSQNQQLLNISTKLNDPAFGGVDSINEVVSPKSGSLITITGEKVEVAGNYVDAVKQDVAAGVVVIIGDKSYIATYGGERPDIAKTLNNPKYLKSQFFLSVPTSDVGKGTHQIKIHVIANDLSGYYESSWVGIINVK